MIILSQIVSVESLFENWFFFMWYIESYFLKNKFHSRLDVTWGKHISCSFITSLWSCFRNDLLLMSFEKNIDFRFCWHIRSYFLKIYLWTSWFILIYYKMQLFINLELSNFKSLFTTNAALGMQLYHN